MLPLLNLLQVVIWCGLDHRRPNLDDKLCAWFKTRPCTEPPWSDNQSLQLHMHKYENTQIRTWEYTNTNTQFTHIYRNSSVSSKHVVDSKPGHVQSPRLDRAITPIIYFAHRQTTINHSSTLYLQAGKTPISLRWNMLNFFIFDSFMMKYLQHSSIP